MSTCKDIHQNDQYLENKEQQHWKVSQGQSKTLIISGKLSSYFTISCYKLFLESNKAPNVKSDAIKMTVVTIVITVIFIALGISLKL